MLDWKELLVLAAALVLTMWLVVPLWNSAMSTNPSFQIS